MSSPHPPVTKLGFRQKLRQSFKPSKLSANQTGNTSAGFTTTQNPVQSAPNITLPSVSNALQSSQSPPLQQQQLSFPSSVSHPLVHKAWTRLSSDDRVILQQYISPTSVDIHVAVGQAITAATDKRKACLDKRWTYTIAGRNVVLREVADRVVHWLDRFKSVGDVIANVDPVHIGLPWAGVRLLLETTVAESNQMAALLVGCETALYMASRLRAYTEFMLQLPITLVQNNLEESIILMYAHVLHFLARAIQTYQTSTTRRIFTAMWRLDEIVEFESRANELANKVERDASNCDRSVSAQDRQILAQIQQNLQQVLADIQQFRRLQASVDGLHLKIDLAKIPFAKGAIFNSSDGTHTLCHPATRVDILLIVQQWAKQPAGKNIYWLHGAAGAGKSTISWTIARWLVDQSSTGSIDLGASFFFKRGQGDRGSAALFFPTIVRQLILQVSGLDAFVAKAIDQDPFIFTKALGEQFRKLLLIPLQAVGPRFAPCPTLVIVVDALDECENDTDVETILQLWSELSNITTIRLRLFLTSRPDPPIRLKFKQMSTALFEDIILQEAVPLTTIEHDLSIYLKDKFSVIRKENHLLYPTDSLLNEDWPGDSILQILTTTAVPLFIVAATICRFVGDPEFDPSERLAEILAYRATGQMAQMELTYLPVLNHLKSQLRDSKDTARLYEEFRVVVGAIICLAEAMSTTDLAILLSKSVLSIKRRLNALHSVLRVPNDDHAPVQTLHLSFAEFLLGEHSRDQPFGIDGSKTHFSLSRHCLRILSGPDGLHENIFELDSPGTLRKDIDQSVVAGKLPQVLQYACRYWVHHVQQSEVHIQDDDEVHAFLQKHFLHWLEALSFMNRISDAIGLLGTLQLLVLPANATQVFSLLEDARRFILANRYVVDTAPLQLYWSAILFAPKNSVVRNVCGRIPMCVKQFPETPLAWGPELQKLEGHKNRIINTVAFSPIGDVLVSGSWGQHVDNARETGDIQLWNCSTGQEVQKLEGHKNGVTSVAFSPNGLLLASASRDKTVRLWNPKTGWCCAIISDHLEEVRTVSLTNTMLASASDNTIRIWNIATKREDRTLEGHTAIVSAVTFSSNNLSLASASADLTVVVWNLVTGQRIWVLNGHTHEAISVAFSPNGSLLASASDDRTVRIWDLATGQVARILNGHTEPVRSVAFSPDGSLLASASDDLNVLLWDTVYFNQLRRLEGHTDWITSLAFSNNGSTLASGSRDSTVRLWNPYAEPRAQAVEAHENRITAITFSHDGTLLASGSVDHSILLWNPKSGRTILKLAGHENWVNALVFSSDGVLLASASSDETIRLWNVRSGRQLLLLNHCAQDADQMAFSHDGSLLASVSNSTTVRIWDIENGEVVRQTEHSADRWFPTLSIRFTEDDESVIVRIDSKTYLLNFASDEQPHELSADSYPDHVETDQHLFCDVVEGFEWIYDCDGRIIWLPQEYRSRKFAIHQNTLALGKSDGTADQTTQMEEAYANPTMANAYIDTSLRTRRVADTPAVTSYPEWRYTTGSEMP